MGEERRFRSHFQVVGERRRQRIHDDRRLYRARSPAQCWRSKKNGPQAIGRSRGGLTTKIHALVDALGNPVELMLTPGQDHDLTCAEPLIENVDPEALIGDKAYDADPFVETLTQRGITPVIPPKANRNIKRESDFALYCERKLVERFFNLLKRCRALFVRASSIGIAGGCYARTVSGHVGSRSPRALFWVCLSRRPWRAAKNAPSRPAP